MPESKSRRETHSPRPRPRPRTDIAVPDIAEPRDNGRADYRPEPPRSPLALGLLACGDSNSMNAASARRAHGRWLRRRT